MYTPFSDPKCRIWWLHIPSNPTLYPHRRLSHYNFPVAISNSQVERTHLSSLQPTLFWIKTHLFNGEMTCWLIQHHPKHGILYFLPVVNTQPQEILSFTNGIPIFPPQKLSFIAGCCSYHPAEPCWTSFSWPPVALLSVLNALFDREYVVYGM